MQRPVHPSFGWMDKKGAQKSLSGNKKKHLKFVNGLTPTSICPPKMCNWQQFQPA